METLRRIQEQTRLENPVSIIQWNLSKRYLHGLEQKGVPIVPTVFCEERITNEMFEEWQREFEQEELIIKPLVSATAGHTYRVNAFVPSLAHVFHKQRPYMIQPFLSSILVEGEYSLFYFGGDLSHVMQKKPKQGDFRVQEDFGGTNTLLRDDDPIRQELVAVGDVALQSVGHKLLYARVDLVRYKNKYVLMELELIEPSLYLRMDPDIPDRFAKAIDHWLKDS